MITFRNAALALLCSSAMTLAFAQLVLPSSGSGSAASASSSAIPYKQDREATGEVTGRVFGALFACLLIGGGVIYVLTRRQRSTGAVVRGQRLQVLETRRLGAKGSMTLVRWDQEELLLVQSDGPVQVVARAPNRASADAPPGASE